MLNSIRDSCERRSSALKDMGLYVDSIAARNTNAITGFILDAGERLVEQSAITVNYHRIILILQT